MLHNLNLNEDQILTLAPDDSSRKAGKDLANPAKWSNTGFNETALWGECQGSGKNPYRAQVDLANIAFKCSCPSRKFPCKHGLGVLLLFARQKALFPETESPDWVKEWVDKRSEKAEKKQEKESKPVDAEAQAKRQQQRQKKVDGGIAELKLVLKDIVRNGILNMPEKASGLFSNLTRRMVDSQAPGLALMTRELSEINYYKDHWQTKFMDQLLRLHLAVTAFEKQESLSEDQQSEIRSLIGFTQGSDELKQQEGIADQWFVLGKETEQQDHLTVQRNWLYGMQSGKHALVLQFYAYTQLPELNFTPGTALEAEITFYKGIDPFRAFVKSAGKTTFPATLTGLENWQAQQKAEKAFYISSPFAGKRPYVIQQMKLARAEGQWFLSDDENKATAILCTQRQVHKMLAISGGAEFTAVLLGEEGVFRPLGIFIQGNYIVL